MTDQVIIKSDFARSKEVDLHNVIDSIGLRVYRDTPFSIHVQVRTRTDKRGRVSGLSITADQAREVAEYLLKKADELRDYAAEQLAARASDQE